MNKNAPEPHQDQRRERINDLCETCENRFPACDIHSRISCISIDDHLPAEITIVKFGAKCEYFIPVKSIHNHKTQLLLF